MMDINFDKMCRICLKEGDNLKSIFHNDDVSNNHLSVSHKIMACTSVQIVAGDGLPELICNDCLTQVDVAYSFREKCQNADATLRKYISLVEPLYSSIEKKTTKNKKKEKLEETRNKKTKVSKKSSGENGGVESEKKKQTKDVKCPICQKTFAYLCFLRDHMVQHTGAKPYLCSACGKSFGHTTSLTNHMKTHYSDKPHKCDRCELSFHRRAHLVLHMRTHTGEKPFVCDVCGRDFAQSSYLKEHMRIHSGEKPFVCDICGHGFARKSGLVMHRRVHTGELPYPCPECGRAFSQRSQRKRHVKKNHKGSACLRATGELILKDLDLKIKNAKSEEILNENLHNDNSVNENSLNIPQESPMIQRDGSVPVHQYQSPNPGPNSHLISYISTGQYFDFIPYSNTPPATYINTDNVAVVR